MKLATYTLPGLVKEKTTLTVDQTIFDQTFNQDLVWQACTAFMAAGRSGSKATLNRSAVRGGGKKPWRQKGTGRARAGTSRSPIWVGGGMTFALSPRDFSQKLNKKMYRLAIKCILSQLIRESRLMVVDALTLSSPKTKQAIELFGELTNERLLLLTHELNESMLLGSRNLFNIHYGLWRSTLNPVVLTRAKKILVTQEALKEIQEWLS